MNTFSVTAGLACSSFRDVKVDALAAAQSLRKTILANLNEMDTERRLPEPVMQGLINSRLCRMALPEELGGLEVAPPMALAVYEELARVEGSIAFIAWNNSLNCMMARFLSEQARKEVMGDAKFIHANSTRPSGKAEITDGGYRVSGRWALVSGCLHAKSIMVMCAVHDKGELQMLAPGIPNMRLMYIPQSSFKILDTWFSGSLRGTGSNDIVLEDHFVPQEMSISFVEPSQMDRPIGRMPMATSMAAGCASICLGLAQAAIDSLTELSGTKVTVDPGPDLRDRPVVQAAVTTAKVKIAALRDYLQASVEQVWSSVQAGDDVSADHLAQIWGTASVTVAECKAATTAMYEAAGTTAVFSNSPIQRAHGDVHAVAQHAILGSSWLEQAGRITFGLEPTHPLFRV